MGEHEDNLEQIFKGSDPREDLSALLHEIKPLIEIIAGYTTLIKRQVEKSSNMEQLPEDFVEWTNRIVSAADDLKRLRDAVIEAWKS